MSAIAFDAASGVNPGQANVSSAVSRSIAQTNEQFMTILLAQLKNQNPLEPMKDNEMMAQLTQLNSLQELQAIKASMEQLAGSTSAGYAAGLIGKQVVALLPDGSTVKGQVSGTTFKQGLYMLNIGEQMVPLSSILEVSAVQAAQPQVTAPATGPVIPTPESPAP